MNIDWTAVGNAIEIVLLSIVGGIVLLIFILWFWYKVKEENEAEKSEREKRGYDEKKRVENEILEQEIKGANLSKAQISILVAIDGLLKKHQSINHPVEANTIIYDVERLLSRFDSGKEDSLFIRGRLEKVYERLMNPEIDIDKIPLSFIAAGFAKEHNL